MLKRIFFISLLIGTVFLAYRSRQVQETKEVNVLRINMAQDSFAFDPRKSAELQSSMVHMLINEGLTRYADNEKGWENGLCETIESSEDGRTWTFNLRDLFWSDGSPLQAEHFVEAWKRAASKSFGCHSPQFFFPIEGMKNFAATGEGEVKLKALSPKKLQLVLEKPLPYLPQLLGYCLFYPVHPKSEELLAKGLIKETPVCGPYIIEEWKRGDHLFLKKNPLYWAQKEVVIDRVEISLIQETQTALNLFKQGKLDLIGHPFSYVPEEIHSSLAAFRLKKVQASGSTFCTFCLDHPFFANAKIRKALDLSIDREKLAVWLDLPKEAIPKSFLPSTLSNLACAFPYEENEAKRLWKEGLLELSLQTPPKVKLTHSIDGIFPKVAQILQAEWKRVLGFDLSLESCEHKIFMDKMLKRDFEIAEAIWVPQFEDSLSLLERLISKDLPKNYADFEDAHYSSLLERSFFAKEKRNDLLAEAEKALFEARPLFPLYHWTQSYFLGKRIDRFSTGPSGLPILRKITLFCNKELDENEKEA